MDDVTRPGASATLLALAVALAGVPGGAGAATSGRLQNGGPRPPPHKAAAPLAGRIRVGARAPLHPASPAPTGPRQPLDLTLPQTKFSAILGQYPADSGGAPSAFGDVTVRAPAELQPMRDPVHEVWGGIGAPVWALLHPTQAWRIFLPIPPK